MTTSAIKAIRDENLTSRYLQKLERQNSRALVLLLFLVMLSFIGLLLPLGDNIGPDGQAIFSNIMYSMSSFVGAYWAFAAAQRANRQPLLLEIRCRLAWTFIGLGLLANGLGNLYYGYMQYISRKEPEVPSFADIGFTLFYILTLAGLLVLAGRARSRRLHLRIVIDSLITTFCLLGICWYLLINPMIKQVPSAGLWQTITTVSYICWDLLLIVAILLFIRQDTAPVLRPSLLICSLGILTQVWADSSYAYLTSNGQYYSGMPMVDPFWTLGFLLIGIATLFQHSAIVRQGYRTSFLARESTGKLILGSENSRSFSRRYVLIHNLLIYIPFALLLICTLTNQTDTNHVLVFFLDALCLSVLILLLMHYTLVTYEHTLLVREKEQHSAEAELLRKATASLASLLETDLLLNQIVTIGASSLGFDATALVVMDEYEHKLDEQSTLLARAATPKSRQIMAWQITGEMIPYCTALMAKEIEILWSTTLSHPATEFHQWHRDQHIHTSLFVPLTYQGKIQGSLAFSLRVGRRFREREGYMARAFAEEVANALEHAHLYEMARENANFARAMANVAARLNSVAATGIDRGSEIHPLICTEATNALGGDLALLYGYHQNAHFVPLAAITDEPEPPTLPQEWPALPCDAFLSSLINGLYPSLFEINQAAPANPPASPINPQQPGQPCSVQQRTHNYPGFEQSSLPLPAGYTFSSQPISWKSRFAQTSTPQSFVALQKALQRRHIQTAILAPLLIHQKPAGLLVLARIHRPGTPLKRAFALQDLTHAQDFASQASIAFTNAHLYQQLHNAHRRMQELDQLKDQFMVTASHELRTPLTAVQGYLELLERYHSSLQAEQMHEFLQKASRGCEELILLLNNVMDASYLEIEAGIHQAHLQRVTVREMVEGVVDLILPQATQEHRNVRVEIPSHLHVKADLTRLRQVILNLSANALKYSPPGSPLLFSARLALSEDPAVVISVTDRGKGIKAQDQSRLFQRFVRLESDLNSAVRGSGLGLYISRRLIEAMRGRIWIESAGVPGMGTTFHVQLPLA